MLVQHFSIDTDIYGYVGKLLIQLFNVRGQVSNSGFNCMKPGSPSGTYVNLGMDHVKITFYL